MHIAHAIAHAIRPALTRLEAQMLMLHTLGQGLHQRAWLLVHDQDTLDAPTLARFEALCQRRAAGEPLAYITGQKEFHGLTLSVDARVLDPRPDTETLVDWGLACVQGVSAPHLLDLGTGSGAIALALAHARPDAQVTALDASSAALDVARANAQRLGLNVQWLLGHWLGDKAQFPRPFDLIVSNPPYIPDADPHLAALSHEPRSALASGPDGLDDIRTIVQQAPAHLVDGGWLLLEHGHDQAARVSELLTQAGLHEVQSHHDIAGIARCTGGQYRATLAMGCRDPISVK